MPAIRSLALFFVAFICGNDLSMVTLFSRNGEGREGREGERGERERRKERKGKERDRGGR